MSNNLSNNIYQMVKKMNVDSIDDIKKLIYFLSHNETIDRNKYKESPIGEIANALGIRIIYNGKMQEIGCLFVNGTTSQSYGSNAVIISNYSLAANVQREVVTSLLGVYLLDFLKNYDGDYSKLYSANYGKTRMNYKAYFFREEFLLSYDIFIRQYLVAAEHYRNLTNVREYLSEYFGVTQNLVENKINGIINGISYPIESTEPTTDQLDVRKCNSLSYQMNLNKYGKSE